MGKTLIIGLLALAALVLAAAVPRGGVDASNPPPATAAALIACPNVDGSIEAPNPPDPDLLGGVRVGDILKVVQAFFHDAPAGFPNAIDADYVLLYDRNANGQQRVDDILNVVQSFFMTCPKVDTQVAQATQWILEDHPELLVEDTTALAAAGYYGLATIDVPGQGVHYGKVENFDIQNAWDEVFDPTDPEGLVYNNGLLVAHLYVIDGADVGWTAEDPGPNQGPCGDNIDNGSDGQTDAADSDCQLGSPSGSPPDDVNIDPFAYCGPGVPCSWDGNEGWHLHYRLCLVHIGTPYAYLTPQPDHQSCKDIQANTPGGGTMYYAERIGWMGHLWNWLPNANLVPDANSTMNGRFADCFPDPYGSKGWWGPYNCPQ